MLWNIYQNIGQFLFNLGSLTVDVW